MPSTNVPENCSDDVSKSNEPVTEPRTKQQDGTTNQPNTRETEIGGQKGPEPTRYGDWEKNGRCTDF